MRPIARETGNASAQCGRSLLSTIALLQSPAVATAIAGDCYILVVLFIFFRPPNFRPSLADFRATLPDDAVCAEVVYLL